MKTTVLSRDI